MYYFDGSAVRNDVKTDYKQLQFKNERYKLISFDEHISDYEKGLINANLSDNTINIYLKVVLKFYEKYGQVDKTNLLHWKADMVDVRKLKPATINQRIIAMNRYLKFYRKTDLFMTEVKCPEKNFLDNSISLKDYHKLQKKLLADGKIKLYYIVTFFGMTGVRVSELIKINVGDVREGSCTIHSKGDRLRKVFIPSRLQKQLLVWLKDEGREGADDDEPLFLNSNGIRMSVSGIQQLVRNAGKKYGIHRLHPHAFRHMFALAWIDEMSKHKVKKGYADFAGCLPSLAVILGHKSINTTYIYLKPGVDTLKAYAERINW